MLQLFDEVKLGLKSLQRQFLVKGGRVKTKETIERDPVPFQIRSVIEERNNRRDNTNNTLNPGNNGNRR